MGCGSGPEFGQELLLRSYREAAKPQAYPKKHPEADWEAITGLWLSSGQAQAAVRPGPAGKSGPFGSHAEKQRESKSPAEPEGQQGPIKAITGKSLKERCLLFPLHSLPTARKRAIAITGNLFLVVGFLTCHKCVSSFCNAWSENLSLTLTGRAGDPLGPKKKARASLAHAFCSLKVRYSLSHASQTSGQ